MSSYFTSSFEYTGLDSMIVSGIARFASASLTVPTVKAVELDFF